MSRILQDPMLAQLYLLLLKKEQEAQGLKDCEAIVCLIARKDEFETIGVIREDNKLYLNVYPALWDILRNGVKAMAANLGFKLDYTEIRNKKREGK